jgi:hypothetical protein
MNTGHTRSRLYVSSNAPLLTSLVGDVAAMADMHPKRKASGVDARLVGWADCALFCAIDGLTWKDARRVSYIHYTDQLGGRLTRSS